MSVPLSLILYLLNILKRHRHVGFKYYCNAIINIDQFIFKFLTLVKSFNHGNRLIQIL